MELVYDKASNGNITSVLREMEFGKKYIVFVDGDTVLDIYKHIYLRKEIFGKTMYFLVAEAYICEDNDKWQLKHCYVTLTRNLLWLIRMGISCASNDNIVAVNMQLRSQLKNAGWEGSYKSVKGMDLSEKGIIFDCNKFNEEMGKYFKMVSRFDYVKWKTFGE